MRTAPVLVAVALLALAGCSGGEPAAPVTVTQTVPGPTVTQTVEGPTETVTVTATPTSEPTTTTTDAQAAEGDLTEQFLAEYGRERWAGDVVEVTGSGDRVEIRTKIVDPRGRDGSPEAEAALDICRAASDLFGAAGVSVKEADDSTYVVKGGNFGPECAEV